MISTVGSKVRVRLGSMTIWAPFHAPEVTPHRSKVTNAGTQEKFHALLGRRRRASGEIQHAKQLLEPFDVELND
jgi:hypothetical protein